MWDYSYLNNKNFVENAHKFISCEHELTKDEIWLGNTSGNKDWECGVDIPNHYSILKTIRLGEQAYDIKGKPLSRDYCRPLIVNKSEYPQVEAIDKERMKAATLGYR